MTLRRIYCEGDNPQNTGYKKICANDLAAVVGFMLLPVGKTMTETQALTESTWTAGIKDDLADRFFPFPPAEDMTPAPKEPTYRDTKFQGQKQTAKGLYGFDFKVDVHYSVAQRLKSHAGAKYQAVLIMENGNFAMTSDDETNLRGFNVQSLTIPLDQFSDGANGHLVNVKLVLADPTEWDLRGWAGKSDDFSIKDLEGLYTVALAASNPATTGVDVSVITDGASASEAAAQWPALTAADFYIETSGGVSKTITGITDNGDGTYHLAATMTAGAHVVGLKKPAQISVASYGIEMKAEATFTVPAQ